MITFRNPCYIVPPGSNKQILSHPFKKSGVVDLAIFQEHRYAFFYWLKWTRALPKGGPPCLVSLDWHQDLCYPCNTERDWLAELDQTNDGEVALFTWAKLAGNNDGHILAAAYLNLIGNVYVHCRQGALDTDWEDEHFKDLYGNIHLIKKFRTHRELRDCLLQTDEEQVYFDIDLDYFTLDNPYNGEGRRFSYMTKSQINHLLSIDNPLTQWIFKRLGGFTIATEPEHCGGLIKSNKLLDIINKLYFEQDIFTNNSDWKHIKK